MTDEVLIRREGAAGFLSLNRPKAIHALTLEMVRAMGDYASWELAEGDELLPGRTVVKAIGGGNRYEVFLVWDAELFALARTLLTMTGGSVSVEDAAHRVLAYAAVPGEAVDPPPHHPPKARRAIHICLCGAMSHVDTFDYKPELVKRHDTPMPGGEIGRAHV